MVFVKAILHQRIIELIIFTCLVLTTLDSYGQDKIIDQGLKTIKIDLDSPKDLKKFPFDENFLIEMVSENNKLIDSVAYYEAVYINGKTILNNKRLRRYARKLPYSKNLDSSNYMPLPLQKGDFKYFKINSSASSPQIYRGLLEPLDPDKIYEFLITKKLNEKQVNLIYEILKLVENDSVDFAERLFNEKLKPLDDNSDYYILAPESMGSFEFLRDSLSIEINRLYSELSNFETEPQSIDNEDIEKYMLMLGSQKISSKEFSETMFGFTNIGGEDNMQVFQGLRAIGSDSLADVKDYGLRKENIKKSIKKLRDVDNQFKKLITHKATDTILPAFYSDNIVKMRTSLVHNDSLISVVAKKANNIISKYYSFTDVVTNSTISKQSKETGLAYLVADIGFVNAFGKDQANQLEYIGRPYIGLNWHITGYNKEKKISQLAQKRFWTRFSLSFGITVGDIDEGGYEDLFGAVSPSVGLNMRLAKNVRLGTGILLFRYNRNPIVSKEGLAPLPYLSLSFDSNFFKEFAIFNTIFGK